MKRKTILYSFKTALPVTAGYIVLGPGFLSLFSILS